MVKPTGSEIVAYHVQEVADKLSHKLVPPNMCNDKFIIVCPVPKYELYRVYKPHFYVVAGLQGMIDTGFLFDGASIPRLLWSMLTTPFNPLLLRAAAIHDHLYRTHLVTKKVADRKFRSVLREDGVDEESAMSMYTAVRWGGHLSYKVGPAKALVGPWDALIATPKKEDGC